MNTKEIIGRISDEYDEMLLADGFDDAIIGVVEGACRPTVVAYDYDRCVKILMDQGMEEEDAHEWMCVNTMGAWVGEQTPMFVHDWRND